MVRDCSRRGLAVLVLVLILSLTATVPGAMASGRAAGTGSLPASLRASPAPLSAGAAIPHASQRDNLWLWLEHLVSKAFGAPLGPPPTADAGGCTDPNGGTCG
jgi:hypothetical protein